jgi:hypothetical protein
MEQELKDIIEGICPMSKSLEERFTELGVESASDLQYVTADDLTPVMKPVQARKLLNKVSGKYSVYYTIYMY